MFAIDNYDFKGKRAIIRVDFNVPLNEKGEVTDDTRIRAAIPTIKKVLEKGGSVILMSHLGRPKKNPDPKFSLEQIVPAIEKRLGVKVMFAGDCMGEKAAEMAGKPQARRGDAARKPAFLCRGGGQAPRPGRRRYRRGEEAAAKKALERGPAERVRQAARFVRRLLHQRCVRYGAPRTRFDGADRRLFPQRQDVRLCDGERAEGHRRHHAQPAAPVLRHPGRFEGFDQDHHHREPPGEGGRPHPGRRYDLHLRGCGGR